MKLIILRADYRGNGKETERTARGIWEVYLVDGLLALLVFLGFLLYLLSLLYLVDELEQVPQVQDHRLSLGGQGHNIIVPPINTHMLTGTHYTHSQH